MHIEACHGRSDRRLLTKCCVVAAAVLVVSCGPQASVPGYQAAVPGEALKIDDVHIRAVDAGISVHYRTSTSIRDCRAQAAEMLKVWDRFVKTRLGESSVQQVVLFPEDTSGQSVGMTFTKSASAQWTASAPCSVSIPAGAPLYPARTSRGHWNIGPRIPAPFTGFAV